MKGSIPFFKVGYKLTLLHMKRVWRNWQTHRTQNPAEATPWRFDSSYPHLKKLREAFYLEITLAQAIPLKNIISRRINELQQEREQVAFVEVEKGEKYSTPERDMKTVENELDESHNDYRILDTLIAKNNLDYSLRWDGNDVTIKEAIEVAKERRNEINKLKYFGSRKKQEKTRGNYMQDSSTITHTLYEPEEYRKRGLKLERQVNRLSQEIEAMNHKITFDFEGAERYLDY